MTAYGALWPGTSSPTLTREGSAVGMTAGANFSAVQPWGGVRRVNVNDAGIITAVCTSTSGGCGYDDYGSNGQVMVLVPQFCLYIDTTGTPPAVAYWIGHVGDSVTLQNTNAYTLKTSDIHPAFVVDGVAKPYILIGAYEAYYNSGTSKLESKAGVAPVATNAPLTIANARIASHRVASSGWGLNTYQTISTLYPLFFIEYASFYARSVLGNGNSNSAGAVNTGYTATAGTVPSGNTSYGTTANTTTPMSYRGVENMWGNVGTFADGINYKANSTPWIAPQSIVNTYACDSFTSPYADTTHTSPAALGWNSVMYPDWEFIPSAAAGTGEIQYYSSYFAGPVTANRVSFIGGTYNSAVYSGLFEVTAQYSSVSSAIFGYRLQYLPM